MERIKDVSHAVEGETLENVIDNPENLDNFRRFNEMGLDVGLVNLEHKIAESEAQAAEELFKANLELRRQQKLPGLISFKEKAVSTITQTLYKSKGDLQKKLTFLAKNRGWMKKLYSKHAVEYVRTTKAYHKGSNRTFRFEDLTKLETAATRVHRMVIEEHPDYYRNEVARSEMNLNKVKSQLERLKWESSFEEAFGIDDAEYRKHVAASRVEWANALGYKYDVEREEVDEDIPRWALKKAVNPVSQWSDEELIKFLEFTQDYRLWATVEGEIMDRKIGEVNRLERKARKVQEDAIEDIFSGDYELDDIFEEDDDIEDIYRAQKKELDYLKEKAHNKQIRKNGKENDKTLARVEASEKYYNGEEEPVVEYLRVEDFWIKDNNGRYLEGSHSVVRPIYESEQAHINEIKKDLHR